MTPYTLGAMKETTKRILAREKRPIYYQDLARLVANEWDMPLSGKEMRDLASDIHEKCLQAGAYETAYIAKPYCVGVLKEWFVDRPLLNVDQERIFLDPMIQRKATVETARRWRYILNKYERSEEDHIGAIYDGLVPEKHVTGVIERRWHVLYRDPPNAGKPEQWCAYDLGLWLPSYVETHGLVTVDVAGPNRYGEYGAVANKPRADLHILAELDGLSVVIKGVESGPRFSNDRFFPEQAQSWSKFVAFLNMEAGPYGYKALADAFWRKLRKVA